MSRDVTQPRRRARLRWGIGLRRQVVPPPVDGFVVDIERPLPKALTDRHGASCRCGLTRCVIDPRGAQIQVKIAKAVGGCAQRARGAFAASFKPDSARTRCCNGNNELIEIIDVPPTQYVVVGKDRDADNRRLCSNCPSGGQPHCCCCGYLLDRPANTRVVFHLVLPRPSATHPMWTQR